MIESVSDTAMEAILKKFALPCCPATAYDTFVNHFAEWWPQETHSISAANGRTPKSLILQPFEQGKVIETLPDGSTEIWGTVLSVQPLQKIEFAWHPGRPNKEATLLEAAFGMETDGTSTVAIIHSGWHTLGDDAKAIAAEYSHDWDVIVGTHFIDACRNAKDVRVPTRPKPTVQRASWLGPIRQALHLT